MTFRPALFPTLLAVPALIVLLGLGHWQLERLQWKRALIAERDAALAAAPVDLAAAGPGSLLRVQVRGRFLSDPPFMLTGRVWKGRPGLELVQAFELDEPASAGGPRVLLVNRGWSPAPDAASLPSDGERVLTGILRRNFTTNLFTPENDPAGNRWYWVDLAAMADRLGRPLVSGLLYLEPGGERAPDDYPRPVSPGSGLTDNHLQYALTWFGFAVTLVVIYLLWHRRQGRLG